VSTDRDEFTYYSAGKSWHIFCVQPCIHNGITEGAELLWNLRLWVFLMTPRKQDTWESLNIP